MKCAVIIAAAAMAGIANAKPHGHAHVHDRREPAAVTTVEGPVATAFAFVLNGQTISQDEVCAGIAKGDLKWEGTAPDHACETTSSTVVAPATSATPTSTTVPTSTSEAEAASSTSSTSAPAVAEFYVATTLSEESAAATTSAAAETSATVAASVSLGTVKEFVASLAQSSYADFPDGEISCSELPTAYGAIPVDHLNLNGWTGLQNVDSSGNVQGDSSVCEDGVMCSYACAPGWQKLQWPSTQPSNGVSIGGLKCSGGLLYKTNSNSQLCGQGNGQIFVQNKASQPASVCRTDYPGTESETIPVDVSAGSTQPLTCPIEEDYYEHLGSSTSAQYYLNPLGVGANPGCSWAGSGDGTHTGNAAPINFGVGQKDGTTWLSIQQNTPTDYSAFSGRVEIVGDGLSAECYYEDGQYCGANGCVSHTVNGAGCTVATTGQATFVISD